MLKSRNFWKILFRREVHRHCIEKRRTACPREVRLLPRLVIGRKNTAMGLWSGFLHSPETVNQLYLLMCLSTGDEGRPIVKDLGWMVCVASSDRTYVETRIGRSKLPSRKRNRVIYGLITCSLGFSWPVGIAEDLGDRYKIHGRFGVVFAGRVFKSTKYNAVVVEGCKSAIADRDIEVIFVRMSDEQKKIWKMIVNNERKCRDQLKAWFREIADTQASFWDINENHVRVQAVYAPNVSMYSSAQDLEEWEGIMLGDGYIVGSVNEESSLTMDGKTSTCVKKDFTTKKDLVFDFCKETDGFMVFIQSTCQGRPDPLPECIYSAVVTCK